MTPLENFKTRLRQSVSRLGAEIKEFPGNRFRDLRTAHENLKARVESMSTLGSAIYEVSLHDWSPELLILGEHPDRCRFCSTEYDEDTTVFNFSGDHSCNDPDCIGQLVHTWTDGDDVPHYNTEGECSR